MTTFAEFEQKQNQLDAEMFLGRLCWYTMSEMRVSHTQIVQGLVAVGLGSHLPPVPKDFDVFRRICSNAQQKKVPVPNEDNTFENYMLREVAGRGEKIVTRRLVVERINRSGKNLGYRQLRDIHFDKETGQISVTTGHMDLVPEFNPTADAVVESVRREFAAWKGMLNAYAIREFVRKLMLSWGATPVRDGVYFLPEDRAAKVDAIDKFVNGLQNASFHSLPLIDDDKQRDMVKKAFQADTVGAIDALMAEVTDLRNGDRKISSDRYAQILTQYQNLMSKTTDYKDVLSTELGETESRLSLFQAQVVALKVKVKD